MKVSDVPSDEGLFIYLDLDVLESFHNVIILCHSDFWCRMNFTHEVVGEQQDLAQAYDWDEYKGMHGGHKTNILKSSRPPL